MLDRDSKIEGIKGETEKEMERGAGSEGKGGGMLRRKGNEGMRENVWREGGSESVGGTNRVKEEWRGEGGRDGLREEERE